MKWVKKNQQNWNKWFAWYPVTVHVDGQDYRVWLETVERRLIIDMFELEYQHRLVGQYEDEASNS